MAVDPKTEPLWRAGRLNYLLHTGQKDLKTNFDNWRSYALQERLQGNMLPGRWPRVFVANCARRFGKDFLGLVIQIEKAIKSPGSIQIYATAFQKDISSIVHPMMQQILEHCPEYLRPEFKQSFHGQEPGYYFPNGSIMRLVGIDVNPDGLRGRKANGVVISEADFVRELENVLVSVIYPQLQGDLDAYIMLNSTPAGDLRSFYLKEVCPDAQANHRYAEFTILDNPMLSDSQRMEYIEAAGGMDSDRCQREYFCKSVKLIKNSVVPEFDTAIHIVDSKKPVYTCGITVVDPGVRDMCAVACGYWDFDRQVLVVCADWAKAGATTVEVAQAIKDCEALAFSGTGMWRNGRLMENPVIRVSDTDARLILDLNTLHGIRIGAADKRGAEAALLALRDAFRKQQIELTPQAAVTAEHIDAAVYNKSRTSYARKDGFGHFDALDVVKYMWRHIDKRTVPTPPEGWLALNNAENTDNLLLFPHHLKGPQEAALDQIKKLLPSSRGTKTWHPLQTRWKQSS